MLHQHQTDLVKFFQLYKNGIVKISIFSQFERMCTDAIVEAINGGFANGCRKRQLYRFIVEMDSPAELLSFSPDLYNYIIYHPLAAQTSLRFAVYSILTRSVDGPAGATNIKTDEIYVVLRLTCLPFTKDLLIERVSDFSNDIDKLNYVVTLGYVTGTTLPNTYVWSSQYFCTNSECPQAGRNSLIRYHNVAGWFALPVVDARCTCDECGSVMVEDKPCRLSGRFQIVHIVSRKSFETPFSTDVEPLTVVLRDELCDSVELGKPYRIIGVPVYERYNKTAINKIIEACSVAESDGANERALPGAAFTNIKGLFEDSAGRSPYRFPLLLAYYFGETVSPPGTFYKIKLLMLMSLMSCNDRRLHLLATGIESEYILRLFDYGRRFANFSSKSGNNHTTSLLPTAKYDINNRCVIQCGAIQAANDGVCSVNLNLLTNLNREKLLKTMELNKISIEIPHKTAGVTCGSSHEMPFRATIWACWESSTVSSKQLPDVQTRFGFVLNTEYQTTDAGYWYSERMIRFITADVVVDAKKPTAKFSDDEWRCFINAARSHETIVSKNAGNLLESYYLTTRRMRVKDCPAKGNEILLTFAIALAKLSFSDEVREHHALMAIRLYEEFSVDLQDNGGVSQLGVVPMSHLYTDDIEDYFCAKNDAQMALFETTLRSYVGASLKVEKRNPLANNTLITNSPGFSDISFVKF